MEAMEESLVTLVVVCVCAVIIGVIGRVLYLVWLKPKMLEMQLRRQGIAGNTYRPLTGDMNDETAAFKEAWSKPMELTHKIAPRVIPWRNPLLLSGKIWFKWNGTTPRVNIWDPDMLREILLNRSGHLIKPEVTNPLIMLLQMGVSNLEGEAWAQRRKLINPAFHFHKLKVPLATCISN